MTEETGLRRRITRIEKNIIYVYDQWRRKLGSAVELPV